MNDQIKITTDDERADEAPEGNEVPAKPADAPLERSPGAMKLDVPNLDGAEVFE